MAGLLVSLKIVVNTFRNYILATFMKTSILSFYQSKPKTVSFLVAFLILLLRQSERFLYPGLWAEDGAVFLRESIMLDFSSLINPLAGYYHTLARLVSYITYKIFPVIAYPYIFMIFCTGIYAYAVSLLSGNEYEKIIKSPYIRFFVSISLCLVPGLNEVLGNLANLPKVLFFILSILLIRDVNTKWKKAELIFIFFIVGSSGEPVVLIPVLLLRLYLLIRIKNKALVWGNAYILLIVLLFSILNFSLRKDLPPGKPPTLEEIIIGTHFMWNQYIMFQPLLGDKMVAKFFDGERTIYRISGIILGTIVLLLCFRKKLYVENFFFPVLFSVFLVPILAWIVRPGSLLTYINIYGIWDHRYSFILSPWGLLFWVFLLSALSYNVPKIKYLLPIFILFYAINSGYRFRLKPYDKSINWFNEYKVADIALKTGCPKKVSIPIHPVLDTNIILGETARFYFTFELQNDKKCNE